jgi:hypothetical protein
MVPCQNLDSQNLDSQNLDSQNLDSQNLDNQNLDSQNLDSQNLYSQFNVGSLTGHRNFRRLSASAGAILQYFEMPITAHTHLFSMGILPRPWSQMPIANPSVFLRCLRKTFQWYIANMLMHRGIHLYVHLLVPVYISPDSTE